MKAPRVENTDSLEAGPLLDKRVAEKVMGMFACDGWKISPGAGGIAKHCNHPNCFPVNGRSVHSPPWFSSKLDDAFKVLLHLKETKGAHFEIASGEGGVYQVCIVWGGEGGCGVGRGDTAPLAICDAALKAVEDSQEA